MFEGRKLVIATKHKKEEVIAPLLEKELGIECFVAENLDTDLLGTFTGEVEREEDPFSTVRKKCVMAMDLAKCDMAIASEGSFGAHPSMFFVHANDEILLFMDRKTGVEIFAREVSTETNFNGKQIKSEGELKDFAKRVHFPSHALILRKTKDDFSDIKKGITNSKTLYALFRKFITNYGTAYIETDMRAMYNPNRMKVIEQGTKKLIDKIKSTCPSCTTPGFTITSAKQGLPCSLCNSPTRSTISYIYSCQKCDFTNEIKFPNNKETEDPMYCDICNP